MSPAGSFSFQWVEAILSAMNTHPISAPPRGAASAAPGGSPAAGTDQRMPTFFIPHGAGPCFFMDWDPADTWDRVAAFLKGIHQTLPQPPRAIVLVSGHWLARDFSVTGHARPELVHDYYGFPAHTYELTYPAPGDPALAARIAKLLEQGGVPAQVDPARGFDHGMFIPLKLMFPKADVPVVQLSLRRDFDPAAHLARIELGLSTPLRVTQCNEIVILFRLTPKHFRPYSGRT